MTLQLLELTPPSTTSSDNNLGTSVILIITILLIVGLSLLFVICVPKLMRVKRAKNDESENLGSVNKYDEIDKSNGHYERITCPICGSRAIAFVTEYHKCIFAKIAQFVFLIITAFCVFGYFTDKLKGNSDSAYIVIAIISAIFTLAFTLYIFYEESKTHVRAICRDCGNLWLLD